MNLDRYKYRANNDYLDYEFDSVGPKGAIRKAVRFFEIEEGIYNLGFGDLNQDKNDISDFSVTNNADSGKVLATIALIAFDFTAVYKDAIIYIEGTTQARTRLYQISISGHWKEISSIFEVQGLVNEQWRPFQKNINYDAFIAWRH